MLHYVVRDTIPFTSILSTGTQYSDQKLCL